MLITLWSAQRHTLILALTALSVTASTTVMAQATTTPADEARAEIAHPRFTAAGVQFASDMIRHHAQAVLICGWAPSHGASLAIREMCERLIITQTDEIMYMQGWLADRGQPVPVGDPALPDTSMSEMGMSSMPGMLSRADLVRLDDARGMRFDRLLLTSMIHHHEGAIAMVHRLTDGAPDEDDTLLIYATNVAADQASEIALMQQRLAAMPSVP